MSSRRLFVTLALASLCACASDAPEAKKTIVEERPPAPQSVKTAQVDVAKAQAQEQAAKDAAAQAAAEESAARAAKEAALAQAAAAKAEMDRKAAEAAELQRKQAATMPDETSPFEYTIEGTGSDFRPEVLPLPADPADYAPLAGFQAMEIPADNPLTPEKAALGRELYHDPRLSGDGSKSCYSCHVCEHGLTDGLALGKGAFDKPLTRSAPSMWNVGYHWALYWDGRSPTLEKQALAAWKGANMGAGEPEKIVALLNATPGYRMQFEAVFGEPASVDNVPKALASHMRTIVGGHTPFDRWQAGDASAVSDSARRGHEVFQRAGCNQCHAGVLFTDMQFHNVGIGMDKPEPDLGRFKASNVETDKGAFKTPTLRDITDSGPYFHDGSVAALADAVDLMLAGGQPNPWLSKDKLKKVVLSAKEKGDLMEFLKSLDEPCEVRAPALPMDG